MICNLIAGVAGWLADLVVGIAPFLEPFAIYGILAPAEWLIVGFFGC